MNVTIEKKPRHYLPEAVDVKWEVLVTFLAELDSREISSEDGLIKWLKDRSELESFLEEDFAWRYIRTSTDTSSDQFKNAFEYFATEIEPRLAPWSDRLNRKLVNSAFTHALDRNPYAVMFKRIRQQIALYRPENIPLQTELQVEQQKFAVISGSMTVKISGKEYTLEQASNFLKDPDRTIRLIAFDRIASRRLQDRVALDYLFDKLLHLRHRVAQNAGFEDFEQYSFASLNRFDYTIEDTLNFHEAIEHEIVPLLKTLASYRKTKLGLDELKPWDMDVDLAGGLALKPFTGANELITKSIAVFSKLDPVFGDCLRSMRENNLFDVESRKNKAPGGYNFPLAETGAPFIFMNAADSFRDVTTMVHEGGHAVQTFLDRSLELNDFSHLPSEVAELASMSMELMSMEHWDEFFPSPADLKRAQRDQLIDSLKTLPWVATIDSFQHWIYTHPGHTTTERSQAWLTIYKRFGGGFSNWQQHENYEEVLWQKQLHLFEVPFYYIEYAIAGLGAIAMWKNFRNDPVSTLDKYKQALALGYTRPIREIYETAGIKFDFSRPYVAELAAFIKEQLDLVLEA